MMESESDLREEMRIENFPELYEDVFSSIDDLPTLPEILWELQGAIQNTQNGSLEIAIIIEKDPSLAVNVLRLANSAFFGAGEKFLSIKDAVTRVGLKEIERLARTVLVIDTFSNVAETMDHVLFWRHSLQVAAIAEFLADRNADHCTLIPEEAYTAGLLHDIGKLLLDQYFPEEFKKVRVYNDLIASTDAEAEQFVLGIDHGRVGAGLMEFWNLEENIVEAVRWHHAPDSAKAGQQADAELVRFADAIWHSRAQDKLDEAALEHPTFTLTPDDLEILSAKLDGIEINSLLGDLS